MENPEAKIRQFLLTKATPFWADASMGHIRSGLSSNKTFVTEVVAQSATIDKGMVRRYKAVVLVSIPDAGKLVNGILEYRFNPSRIKAHTVTLVLV